MAISQNLNMGLTKIYNSIFENNNINHLIKSYFSIHNRKKSYFNSLEIDKKEIICSKKIINSFSKHYGSFDKNYPLANTQREAFACYLENKNILPVNGAPGTGKTALLRAIFGDYTVKTALESYKYYDEYNTVIFRTSIVCSSTNNQALTNVSEGIDSGFEEVTTLSENNLYKRWISDIKLGERNIKFNNNMFVPSIKGKVNGKYELTKANIEEICDNSAKNPIYFLNEYFKYRDIKFEYKKIDKRTLGYLRDSAKFFYKKIKDNVEIINNITKNIQKEVTNLSQIETELIEKYIKKGLQEDIIKATFFSLKENLLQDNNIINEFQKFQRQLVTLKIEKQEKEIYIENIKDSYFVLENNIIDNTNKIKNINKKIIIEIEYLDNYVNSPIYHDIDKSLKIKYKKLLDSEKNKIYEKIDEDIKLLREKASIIDKIKYGLFKNGKLKESYDSFNDLLKERILSINTSFYEQSFFKDELKENILNTHNSKIKELNLELDEYEKKIILDENTLRKLEMNIYENKNFIEQLDITQLNIQIKLDEKFDILADNIFDFEDIVKLFQYREIYNNLENIKERNIKYDTSIRTDNFYYSIHLLEALFFIKNINTWNSEIMINSFNNKSIVCPICKIGTMYQSEAKDKIKCSNILCNGLYSLNNKFNPKELNIEQIQYILKNTEASIDGKIYKIKINNNFINIVIEKKKSKFDFSAIYPIFPIINITCNSFGTIVSDRDSNIVNNDIFDFILIDEAGTIPPSKMVILNCAKRVMLFGDTQQLKPVFAYDSKIENRILKDIFHNKYDIQFIANNFSCAARMKDEAIIKKNNNAMDIANSCCNYLLPYNKSKMQGDIWLKEHFRCQTPIINISNEISYFNEILPYKKPINTNNSKKQSWSTLLFVEHNYEKKSDNTNPKEADKIISFIEINKEKYINDFLKLIKIKDGIEPKITDEDYYNSIGIITPFVNQENLIKEKIIEKFGRSAENKHEPIIKVGTVHKYQGSEREIILFSSVYNQESNGKAQNLFFNRDEADMINVAVTRAKEVFVLFGNSKTISNPKTFSGIMVKHINEYQSKK